jgi:hypothetical protein
VFASATAGFALARAGVASAEPPPETTRLRLSKVSSICLARGHGEGLAAGDERYLYVGVDTSCALGALTDLTAVAPVMGAVDFESYRALGAQWRSL